VIGVNISLGLEDANREYLDYISKQNSDVIFIELKGSEKQTIYENGNPKAKDGNNQEYMDFCDKEIIDPVSKSVIGSLHLHFSREDFDKLQSDNNRLTLKLLFMTFILLGLFLLLIQRELRPLKKLSESVCSYDPRLNNFALTPTIGTDEVGLIQNAIITMVEKIALHTHMLDEINHSLEDKIKERTKELEEANRQLKTLAITDMLTQLPNRRYFEEYYAKSWELAKRTGVNLSIVMCDIDHFKKVNDTYGHQIGDEVLIRVAATLKLTLKRETDLIARYGGEEFILILYDTDLNDAEKICNKMQENLKIAQEKSYTKEAVAPVTMSFGISCTKPGRDEESESLIKKADDALYKAKESGRNCVSIK